MDLDPTSEPRALTPHARLDKIEVIVNPRSGSVSATAAEELSTLLHGLGLKANIHIFDGGRLTPLLDDVFGAQPDLIIVLAGDGTVRAVAARAGADGPLIAPLPGGTMNMLPKAVYGVADWKAALTSALTEGCERPIPGGRIGEEPFYCAAILGSPALWAPAREAIREGKARLAWLYGRRALRRAFSGRVRYRLDRGPLRRAEALVLITPLISTAVNKAEGLEAAAMTPARAGEAFRMAARALFADWRSDPAVATQVVKRAHAWAGSRIPAILDGETIRLDDFAEVTFEPVAFRALAPPPEPTV